MRHHLVIFVKQPAVGAVKTRLAADIGPVRATQWYRRQMQNLVRRLGRDPRWQTWLAAAPDTAVPQFRRWLQRGIGVLPQGRGDLGTRMSRIFRIMPPGPVLLIGSDIPGISPRHIVDGFKALGSAETVFGPSPDGGYWLVGQKRLRSQPDLFAGVPWSTATTLAETVARAAGRVHYLAELRDVDTALDLEILGRQAQAKSSY